VLESAPSQLKEPSADQRQPQQIEGTGNCHKHDSRERYEGSENGVGQVEPMRHYTCVSDCPGENVAAKHDHGYHHRSGLQQDGPDPGAGPVPDVGGQDRLSRGLELYSRGLGRGGRILVAEGDHRESCGRCENERYAGEY